MKIDLTPVQATLIAFAAERRARIVKAADEGVNDVVSKVMAEHRLAPDTMVKINVDKTGFPCSIEWEAPKSVDPTLPLALQEG